MLNTIEDKQIVSIARRVTWIGFVVNAILAASKIVGGLYGKSDALFADGIHSLSDFCDRYHSYSVYRLGTSPC